MTDFSPQAAAEALVRARRLPRAPLHKLPSHPHTLAEGIAAQVALAAALGADPPAGFKIGATARVMQEYLGLPGPAAGFMAASALSANGSTLAFERFFRPGVECELAVELAHDVPRGSCSPEAAAASVGTLCAAIELVENRYADLAQFGAPAMVADQVFHAAAVLGEPYPEWRALDLLSLHGTISFDGEERGEGHGRDLLGGPWQALAWLAASAEVAAFGGLRAGQTVLLGSVCPPVWLERPGVIEVRFPPLPPVRVDLVATTR